MDVRADGDIADNFWWRRTTLTRRTPLYDACVSVGLLVAATIVGALLDHPGLAPSIMIVYVFAVQLCAFFTWSRLYCLLSSAAAVALYNFLFVDPRYSLSLIDRVYPGMFFIMFVVSLVSSCRQRPSHAYGARDQPHAATVCRSAADCACHGNAAGSTFGLSGRVVQRRRRR